MSHMETSLLLISVNITKEECFEIHTGSLRFMFGILTLYRGKVSADQQSFIKQVWICAFHQMMSKTGHS